MKKLFTLFCCFALVSVAWAQKKPRASEQKKKTSRDLYVSKDEPGVKMTIELNRNGKTQFVPPETEFKSGDKVAFHFEVNFAGYVAIINDGTSGKKTLLFPYPGVGNQIPANQTYRIPQQGNWFKFDERAGEEKLIFVMSTKSLQGINQTSSGTTNSPSSSGGQVSGLEEQQILNELNSRALRKGRDLVLEKDQSNGYVTTSQQSLAEPIGFLIKLIHR